ncbi:MAG: ATP-binding protein [Saprospiraceae bacterium]
MNWGNSFAQSPTDSTFSATSVFTITEASTNFLLRHHWQVLPDSAGEYSINEIAQPYLQGKFQPYSDRAFSLTNYQYYWGKIQVRNSSANATELTEWVLSFSNTWTTLDIFTKNQTGDWQRQANGTFTSEYDKKFAPTARGNLVKIPLPPDEIVTLYFRGISERTAINPSGYIRLQHIDTFYRDLLAKKVGNAFFMGFLLMMFLYNLMLYFYGRDRSFLFYSGYLLMMVVYTAYLSDDIVDWFGGLGFAQYPQYSLFLKLSLYLGLMCYLAFIRSFLDLEQLLPKWDKFYKIIIYLGFPLMLLDVTILCLTNFSYVVEDRVTVSYIVLSAIALVTLPFSLYRTRDKKGYFIIAGVAALGIGALITVLTRVALPPFTLFYLKLGTIVEIIIFSLGLAYRLKQQREEKQLADFALKESQLLQEQKATEAARLQELNDFKTRFYTNITHEFRTPLTIISGISDQIKKQPQVKELIQRNSTNLLQLINQLLDLSKLETSKLQLKEVQNDIILYLQYLTESFYSNAQQRDIRFVFYTEVKKLWMDYDEEKIQQIVYNLISNALKFTPAGGKIVLHANRFEIAEQAFLQLKIKDTGIGIEATAREHIFDRFYQVESTQDVTGTGIGLALTKELVELMQGEIKVESDVGAGTEFIIHLPIKNTAAFAEQLPLIKQPTTIQQVANITKSGSSLTSNLPLLLIIEDNADIVTYIQSILKFNYQIKVATNGAAGIEKAVEIIPDIIISDVMMPKKDGYKVCKILKKDDRTSHIPIILLTAKSLQTDRIAGLKYGADAYLTKPFDKEELLVRLEKLLELRRQLQQRYAQANLSNLKNNTPSPDTTFLQKLANLLEQYAQNAEFGVNELAAAADLKPMQLYRKLKALTDKTPSQFIRSYRLQRALELLKKRELNISEVAYEVGFNDPAYFSRVFQKEFGSNPTDYLSH